jgi:Putative peptidoglycan binding domain
MKSSKISTLATGAALLLAAGLLSGCGEEPEEAVNQSEGMAIAPMPSEETVGEPIAAIEDSEDYGMEGLEGLEGIDTIDGIDNVGDLDESDPFNDMLEGASETTDEAIEAIGEGIDQAGEAMSEAVDVSIDSTQVVVDEDEVQTESETQTTTLAAIGETETLAMDDDATEVVTVTPEIIQGVQQALVDAGFNPGPVDGISGPRTLAALESFQQQNNIAAGEFTKETLRALGVDY